MVATSAGGATAAVVASCRVGVRGHVRCSESSSPRSIVIRKCVTAPNEQLPNCTLSPSLIAQGKGRDPTQPRDRSFLKVEHGGKRISDDEKTIGR